MTTNNKDVLGSKDVPDTRFLSTKEKFNLLLPERRLQLLKSLSDEDAAKLHYDWEYSGRPKQLAPDHEKSRATSFCMCKFLEAQLGTDKQLKIEQFPSCTGKTSIEVVTDLDTGVQTIVHHDEPKVCVHRQNWSVWVLLAGRGFGKTRVGAEFIQNMVGTGQAKRIHIIAPTAADARDVAVEGESGILTIAPPWNRPLYESTKRRLTWPNGATASLFSAEEPERLRGPQCDTVWCFIAGTQIETEFGKKNIEDIKVGDKVHTRQGLKRVYDSRMTGVKQTVTAYLSNGKTITATPNHKFWVEGQGWLELQFIKPSAILYSFKGYSECQSYTKESYIRQSLVGILQIETGWHFIVKSMKTALGLFQTDMTSITIAPKTWKPYQDLNISEYTISRDVSQSPQKRNKSTQINSGKKTRAEKYLAKIVERFTLHSTNGVDGAQISALLKAEQKVLSIHQKLILKLVSVKSVRFLLQLLSSALTVLQNATIKDTNTPTYVLYVTPHLSPIENNVLVQNLVGTNSVFWLNHLTRAFGKNGKKSIKKNGNSLGQPVWNLSVEDAHEYFANGVLTKNCDELAAWDPNAQQMVWDMMNFGLRLGKNPRAVVTTTPKPTVLIQNLVKQAKDPKQRTVITTGSTYENRTNLAAPFMRQITQYEGTNLGRQEIYAELIDIEESGILKRSWFKQWSANKAFPHIEFVLQSYDTAFTANTENDPTGQLAFGIFRPSPDEPYSVILMDAWTEHLKYPELRKKSIEEYKNTYGPQEAKVDILLIEDKGSGIALIQDLQRAGLPIRKYNPGRPDKVMRLHAVSHLVYNGRVYIPESKKVPGEFITWSEDFIREVCSFPNSPHDEYVDCLSQALAFFRDQEWIGVDPEPVKDPFEDEDNWQEEITYSNPYAT